MTGDDGNFGPMLLLTDKKSKGRLAAIEEMIKAKEKGIKLSKERAVKIKL